MPVGRCRSCGTLVTWVRSAAHDRPMPLVAAREGNGNVVIRDGRAHVVEVGRGTHVSHFADCAKAAEHRRPRA